MDAAYSQNTDGLRDYLISNQTRATTNDPAHSRLLNDISDRIRGMRIPASAEIFKEVELPKDKGYVDLVVLSEEALYLIGAKVSKKSISPHKFKEQLNIAYRFFKDEFAIEAKCMGVCRRGKGKKFSFRKIDMHDAEVKRRFS